MRSLEANIEDTVNDAMSSEYTQQRCKRLTAGSSGSPTRVYGTTSAPLFSTEWDVEVDSGKNTGISVVERSVQ